MYTSEIIHPKNKKLCIKKIGIPNKVFHKNKIFIFLNP